MPGDHFILINKAWILRLAVLTASSIALIPARSQVETSTTATQTSVTQDTASGSKPPFERRRRTDRSADAPETVGKDHRDDTHRHNPSEFRKLMQSELDYIPALDKRMDRLMNIQAQRFDLQKGRQKVADAPETDRDATVRKFHSLLRRDAELADESRTIVQEIVRDMPRIKAQLVGRRSALQAELGADNLTTETGAAPDTSSTLVREQRRRLRYLDFLESKLDDLKVHPERLDLLARVLRGLPFEDAPTNDRPPGDGPPRPSQGSLPELYGRRKALQRELRQVEKRIHELEKPDQQTSAPQATQAPDRKARAGD